MMENMVQTSNKNDLLYYHDIHCNGYYNFILLIIDLSAFQKKLQSYEFQ